MADFITVQHKQMDTPRAIAKSANSNPSLHRTANTMLLSFTLSCVMGRLIVLQIMRHQIPSLYVHINGLHVHHFVYGFCILSVLAGYAVMCRPTGAAHVITATLYGIVLAMTFDEFGVWTNLGGAYWQRGSMEAMLTIFAVLLITAHWPYWRRAFSAWGTSSIPGLLSVALFSLAVVSVIVLWCGTEDGFPLKYIAPYIRHVEFHGPG